MVEEIYSLYTIFWTKRKDVVQHKHYWVWCTWFYPQPRGLSKCKPGDLYTSLRENFGRDAIGSMSLPDPFNEIHHHLTFVLVLVNGKLWTHESVFWQNMLQDRARYEVVYRTVPKLLQNGTRELTVFKHRKTFLFSVLTDPPRS